MNGPSETATLPPLTTTPIQSNGSLFSSYYNHHQQQQHHHNYHGKNYSTLNGHYHLYSSSINNNQTNNINNESIKPILNGNDNDDIHVTVLKIDQQQLQQSKNITYNKNHFNSNYNNDNKHQLNNDFVTVLTIVSTGATIMTPSSSTITTTISNHTKMNDIGLSSTNYNNNNNNNQTIFVDNKRGEIEEEVIIYRLPGERLGMALRFDGGQSANETIRHVFVQSITLNSPSSKAIGLMLGMLREGDEILQIDGRPSSSLTRLECITLLRDAPVCIRLFVRRRNCSNSIINNNEINGNVAQNCQTCNSQQKQHSTSMTTTTITTTMTTVTVPKVSNCCQMPIIMPNNSHQISNFNQNHDQTEVQNRLSSSTSSLISPANTPLLTQLLNSCSDQSITSTINNKKVPPPVPPRMATTTLSSKRKQKPMSIPPALISENSNEIIVDQNCQNDNNVNLFNKTQNQSSEMTMIIKKNGSSSNNGIENEEHLTPFVRQENSQLSLTQQSIEKPPRRKNSLTNNLNVTNPPPPLPPRRPKGPPPKPPIDRIQSNPSIVNVVNLIQNQQQKQNQINNQNLINDNISLHTTPIVTNTKSLPSLITVIHSPTNSNIKSNGIDFVDLKKNKSINVESQPHKSNDFIKTPLSISSSSNNTAKVAFNISNSKVSSFIRQTAEKLHRKLSGKTNSISSSLSSSSSSSLSSTSLSSSSSSSSNGESDEEKDVQMNPFKKYEENNDQNLKTVIEDLDDTTIDNNEEKIQGMNSNDVIITNNNNNNNDDGDNNNNNNNNKSNVEIDVNEKITFTIIPSPVSILSATPPPTAASYTDFNQEIEELFESDTDDTSSSVSTIIERGTFNGNNHLIEQEQINDIDEYNIDDISIVDRVLSPFDKMDNKKFSMKRSPINMKTINVVNGTEMNLSAQSMVMNLATVIEKEEQKQQQQHQLSLNKTKNELINNDEQLMMNEEKNNSVISNKSILIDASPNSIVNNTDNIRRDHLQIDDVDVDNNVKTDDEKHQSSNNSLNDNFIIHSDDEDLNEITNDLFSRLDDDKDDFMIDTDYLNESSSRFMFHHNSSELILNTYSELSSITEEDEDDDNCNIEIKYSDNNNNFNKTISGKQQQQQQHEKPVIPEKPIINNDTKDKMNGMKSILINKNNEYQENEKINDIKIEINNNEMNKSSSSDCSSLSSSSSSDQTKVSLDNVFEFLNKANDDFEFVERMLELTNDKIDSIDDIMRIRESLRGLQESDQRENLQRFLDGKDVFEELIALSSPSSNSSSSSMFSSSTSSSSSSSSSSHSSAPSSPDHDFPPSDHHHQHNHNHNQPNINIKSNTNIKIIKTITPPTQNHIQTDNSNDYVSLPVCFTDQSTSPTNNPSKLLQNSQLTTNEQSKQPTQKIVNKSIIMNGKLDQPIDSKIPTLFPVINKPTLNKRSQSVSNIFTRSNSTLSNSSFNSLIETKPSLIPRPISNFNLLLPQSTINNNNNNNSLKNVSQQRSSINRTTSHNCLNRSTSMQSIFSTNSLSRSTKPTTKLNNSTTTLPRRQLSGLSSYSTATTVSKNYHHNCLNHSDGSPYSYGSLSRNVSKSSTNVYYNTGSLPRPINNNNNNRQTLLNANRNNLNNNDNNGRHRDFHTTSLTDLTYNGGTNNNKRNTIRNGRITNKNNNDARKQNSCSTKKPIILSKHNSKQQQQQQKQQNNSKLPIIKPKPILFVTEIRTKKLNIINADNNNNNNNSITINGDNNHLDNNNNNNDDDNNNINNKTIIIKNHCTIKPPVVTLESKKFEEIF